MKYQDTLTPRIQAGDSKAKQRTSPDGDSGPSLVANPMLDWLGWWTYLMIMAGPASATAGGEPLTLERANGRSLTGPQ
jgi:hypothetical protein